MKNSPDTLKEVVNIIVPRWKVKLLAFLGYVGGVCINYEYFFETEKYFIRKRLIRYLETHTLPTPWYITKSFEWILSDITLVLWSDKRISLHWEEESVEKCWESEPLSRQAKKDCYKLQSILFWNILLSIPKFTKEWNTQAYLDGIKDQK